MISKYTLEYANSLPKFDRSVSLLCWAYNEEESIEEFIVRIYELLSKNIVDFEIVIVDDCSTDRTNEIIKKLQTKIPQIKLYRNEKNMNVGYSCRRAISCATKEYLFWQTIDWSYDISYLRIYLELLKEYDIVAGVRRKPVTETDRIHKNFIGIFRLFGINHITKRSDNIKKAIVSIINYLLIRFLFRISLSDFQNVVFYPTKHLQSFSYEGKSSFVNPELLIKSHWLGKSIVEVPISFIPRKVGSAKGTRLKAIITSVIDVFSLWFKWIVLNKRNFLSKGAIKRYNDKEWDME